MRREAREAAFKAVFAELLGGGIPSAGRGALYSSAKLSEDDRSFAEKLYLTAERDRAELDGMINGAVTRFADYRIYTADRAVLLIALAERRAFPEVPPVVTMDEAVNLAAKYSTERSADFVNGVLSALVGGGQT